MKYGLSHDRGKYVTYLELEKLSNETKNTLSHLINNLEIHPLHNGIRFSPSRPDYQKQINLLLKTKVVPRKNYNFTIHKD